MKWFKHFSDSLDDPFIQELLDQYGAQGYLAYFGLLEITAKENGIKLTGLLDIKPSYLRRKFRISMTKLEQIFNFCATSNKLSVNFSEKLWHFSIPKLLDLKDNYTKDLQATGKKPSNHKEVEVEEDKEVEEETHRPPSNVKPKKTTKKNGKFIKPTIAEIEEYCTSRNNSINAETFFHHYEARDWTFPKGGKVKSWKSCVITWEGNGYQPKQAVDKDAGIKKWMAKMEKEVAEDEQAGLSEVRNANEGNAGGIYTGEADI